MLPLASLELKLHACQIITLVLLTSTQNSKEGGKGGLKVREQQPMTSLGLMSKFSGHKTRKFTA